jgi:hypothetical protein
MRHEFSRSIGSGSMHVPTVFPKEETWDLGLGIEDGLEVTVVVVDEEGCIDCSENLFVSIFP